MVDQLLGAADIRRLAAELGVTPTKVLGQNFVHDGNTVRKIVASAGLTPDDVVVEVGPGLGSLTLALLPNAAAVHAVELDPKLAAALPGTVADKAPSQAGKLTVITADALRVKASDFPSPPTALVANLPYNVAVPVVLTLLAELPSLAKGLVMVQAEVADRMIAGPGSKIYGVPSLKLAWYASSQWAGPISRAVFWPVPNVDSGLVSFTRREPPQTDVPRAAVFAAVDAAFGQRRKMLRSSLADWAGGAARATELLEAAGVDPTARAETLTIQQFCAIAAAKVAAE
ncbi:16S rRNA (adenine(1518)-N(6)/adenine(1519)-N(6))-dimethyltransferase RsmA [Longispora sp. NPDC051575]|uniref:16S rRNA (adenine(1518)-N(6)/adenine(1519)-N(6))- dimethyltransferase RsmA n=1 Tax=Longispora sp. NPDC051575 TaxID=3154943 RepID=UPI00341D9697